MVHAEPVRTAPQEMTWSAGCLVVAGVLCLGAGAFIGWANVIQAYVTLVVLLAPTMVMQRYVGRLKLRNRIIAITLGLLLVGVWGWVFSGPLAYWFGTVGWGNRPFESAVWKAATPRLNHNDDPEHNPRGAMLRSLLRDHRLRGMSKQEVVALLGKPDRSAQPEPDLLQLETWDYYVGWYSGSRMDADFLSVVFETDGKLVGWRVWQS